MASPNHDPVVTEFDGKHVRLVRRGKWEYVTRKKLSGIVGILALTDDARVILIEQYRPPLNAHVIEIPAGLAGDVAGHESEDLADAARRELLEETGYEAASMTHLTEGVPSAGITDEVIRIYRATGLKKTGDAAGDGSEQITVHEAPLPEVDAWLNARRDEGKFVDLKVYAALYFLRT